MSQSERIKKAMEDAKIPSAAELARQAGLKEGRVRTYLLNTRHAPLDVCQKLAKVLGCEAAWLFEGTGPVKSQSGEKIESNIGAIKKVNNNHSPRVIPLYGSALAGPDGSFALEKPVVDMIEAPAVIGDVQDAYAVYVVGESMEPRYEPGEIVFVHPRLPVRRGDYVLVQVAQDENDGLIEGFIKKFESISDATLVVSQFNPKKEIRFARNRVRAVHKIVSSSIG